jgi:hypothetical protein
MRPVRLTGVRCLEVGALCALLGIAALVAVLRHRPAKVASVPGEAAPLGKVSGKNWRYELSFPVYNSSKLGSLIQCESQGLNISSIDSQGQMHQGILQFDGRTWNEMEQRFDFHGDPRNPAEAIHMADMMISSGLIARWTCARSLGLAK